MQVCRPEEAEEMLLIGAEDAGGREHGCSDAVFSVLDQLLPENSGPLNFFAFKKLFNSLNLKASYHHYGHEGPEGSWCTGDSRRSRLVSSPSDSSQLSTQMARLHSRGSRRLDKIVPCDAVPGLLAASILASSDAAIPMNF